jgi:oligopeptide transport system permease protein
MRRIIIRRLLQLPLILLVVYTLTLALAWAVPGNPLEGPEGRRPDPEVAAVMRAQYNLDSFWTFYWSYLEDASGASRLLGRHQANAPIFNLGPSLQYPERSVNEILAASLPISATIGLLAIFFGLAVGVTVGVVGARKPGSWLDHASFGVVLLGISLPTFVIGSALQSVFSLWLGWLPVAEWGQPRNLILPVVTLGLPYAAAIARLTRMSIVGELGKDFVRTARAKGLGEGAILWRHVLPNAILPVVSYLGPAAAGAMTGSFVVERVFSVPGGLGEHFVNAVQNKDLFLIIGVVLVFSAMLVTLNMGVDLAYRWIDPRLRT